MQIGRKKMALDHALVESMDAHAKNGEPGEDLESILKHGAEALFNDGEKEKIKYDAAAIDKLLDRAAIKPTVAAHDEEDDAKGTTFSYARVWQNDSGDLANDLEVDENAEVPMSVWDAILKQREDEAKRRAELNKEVLGRGGRRRQVSQLHRPSTFDRILKFLLSRLSSTPAMLLRALSQLKVVLRRGCLLILTRTSLAVIPRTVTLKTVKLILERTHKDRQRKVPHALERLQSSRPQRSNSLTRTHLSQPHRSDPAPESPRRPRKPQHPESASQHKAKRPRPSEEAARAPQEIRRRPKRREQRRRRQRPPKPRARARHFNWRRTARGRRRQRERKARTSSRRTRFSRTPSRREPSRRVPTRGIRTAPYWNPASLLEHRRTRTSVHTWLANRRSRYPATATARNLRSIPQHTVP